MLHSALAAVSVEAFGATEFTLRIPALLGCGLFLFCLARLIERTFFPGHRWLQWLVYAVVAGNPLVLDLLCLARGYSLALGFLVFALLRLLDYWERREPRDLRWMSLALALTVASNLALTFPAIATMGVALYLVIRQGSWRTHLKPALLPAFVALAALLALPLTRAERNNFYWGAKNLRESVANTAEPFFHHHPVDPGPFGSEKIMNRFKRRFLPVALLALVLATMHWLLRGERGPLVLVSSVFLISLFGHWLANAWLGVLYPSERTGVALVVLFFVAYGGALSFLIRYRTAAWLLAAPSALIFAVLLIQFAQQLDPSYTWAWHSERDNRRIADLLRERGVRTLSMYWTLQPAMEFYRRTGRIPGIAEPIRGYGGDRIPWTQHDAYIFYKPDEAKLAASGLDVGYRNDITGVIVAFQPR